jgi:hypothetical protein
MIRRKQMNENYFEKLIRLETDRENAIGHYKHYIMVHDYEMANWWEEELQHIENEMIRLHNAQQ